jgi:hypothetical protein
MAVWAVRGRHTPHHTADLNRAGHRSPD